ncbi:MAG: efflux RND transporter permease subunit [Planctomycetota bacterium]|jgi:HAE1 family hydrophobic/amphiphilic exporter-1
MNLPRAAVSRPVFTTMATLIVVILGTVSLLRLRIDLLPNVELPTATVRTQWEGASPEVMERQVTQILEEIIATVPGVEEMTSESSEGNSRIRVTFGWGTDIDAAALDLQATIEDEINELPDNIVRPRVSKFDIASFPVVILGISSSLDPVELTEFIEDQIRYRFARIPGIAQVDTWGGFNREVRVELDPDRLRAFQIPLDTILDRIRDSNLDLPAGKIEAGRHEVSLRAPAEFQNLDELRNTVVLNREGSVVTLGQVAEIHDTYEKLTRIVRVNGQRGLRVAIRKQANANTVEVADRVLQEIEAVNAEFPQVRIVPVVNQGNFIERSIENVARSVMYGGGLALLVLLVFLRNLRSTFLIAIAIPISGIATFSLIYFGGFTLNLMTLGGLALGVGMMVDSSVVVLENIFRRRVEEKESQREAAVHGSTEVASAIVASTITTLVIFLPLIFVRGVTGILFEELAYVIMFSLFAALVVSLSVVPMLSSKLLRGGEGPRGRLAAAGDRFFGGLENGYKDLLGWVLRHRVVTVGIALALFVASLQLGPLLGSEFIPPSDEAEVRVSGEMELGTRLDIVDRQTRLMENVVFPNVPEMVGSVVSVGATGWRASDAGRGQIQLSLTPAAQRERSNVEVANDLRRRLEGKIPGMRIRARARQGQFLLERVLGGDEGLKVEVRGYELEILDSLARRALERIEDIPGISDVELSRKAGLPQREIQVDRDRAADVGLTVRDVAEVIETAVAGSQAGDFRAGGQSYRILVQLQNAERRTIDEILDLTVATPNGDAVVLRNVVDTNAGTGPLLIDRKDQQRLVTVEANVVGRDMGSVARDVQARLDEIPRPTGFELHVAGKYEEQEKAFAELIESLVLALLLVYMVLACQYESFRDPLVVMFSVPLAAIGVLVTLFLTETTLNVQSYIGCIMLGGIVVNNAILLVDQAGKLRTDGRGVREAVAEAGRRRLRPILMTSLTTALALMPLALGVGEGADAQAPLARAVVGGLLASTLITLVLIPAVYSLFHPEKS